MKTLILGGTQFVGRHLAEAALARGHKVTLFHRGRTGPELFPDAEHVLGDRDSDDLETLRGRTWDAVLDTCGYLPRVVRRSAALLAPSAGAYVFISTISVYADFTAPGLDETAPLGVWEDPSAEAVTNSNYGPLKALCEQAVEEAFPGRSLIVRPGFIAGPFDPTDRFTYWVRRAAQGGEMAAPGTPRQPLQIIDARDLAAWTLQMLEAGTVGIFNAAGPASPLTFGEFLEAARTVSGSDARLHWVSDALLQEQGITLPLAVPADSGLDGLMTASLAKALAHGLTFRPLAETIADTLAWDRTRPADVPLKAGLTPEREQALLGLAS